MSSPASTYADVIPIMEAALARDNGVRYRLPTWGKALNFRQRCYRYRVRYRAEEAQRLGPIPGLIPRSPYDHLQISIQSPTGEDFTRSCPEGLRSSPFDVVIRPGSPGGQLLDEEGNPIELHDEEQISGLGLDIK